jgi:hypothetical protein
MIYKMEEEYVSLFDYLGSPAGEKLGYEVATAAGKAGEPTKTKMVANAKYKGRVNMFRREFLNEYFNK